MLKKIFFCVFFPGMVFVCVFSGDENNPVVTATSFIDWQGMYIPERIFDGKAETAWLEAADGAGIGEKITLVLGSEITVDEIKFMPGYFDEKWWKSNNRVKKLNFDYGDKNYNVTFKDEMKVQSIKLPEPVSFTKIVFTIRDIYPSNKDNDTAISEIEFWYKGEKIDPGFSEGDKAVDETDDEE